MKFFWAGLIFLCTLVIFMLLEYGQWTGSFSALAQPLIFAAVTAAIFLFGKSRQFILPVTGIFFALMVFFYLSDSLFISNWIGGLGMGIFVILIFSYLPKLIKDGHI